MNKFKRLLSIISVISIIIGVGGQGAVSSSADSLPEGFSSLIVISNDSYVFGFDKATGLGKMYDKKTEKVWQQYYASPTVDTQIVPYKFDDTYAWTIDGGEVDIYGNNTVIYDLESVTNSASLNLAYPGKKIYSGNYQLRIKYNTENASGFSLTTEFIGWRDNLNTANNGDNYLFTLAAPVKDHRNGVADGEHEIVLDIFQSDFNEHTAFYSIHFNINVTEPKGKLTVNSIELIGKEGSKAPVSVSNVNSDGKEITLKVNSNERKQNNLPAADCKIYFDEDGYLKYDLSMDPNAKYEERIDYPPTFYDNSTDLEWLIPKDSGLLLKACDIDSYMNKSLGLGAFYGASGLSMGFFGGLNAKDNSGYLAIIDNPVQCSVVYPQTQLGENQGFMPVITQQNDKEIWLEDRSVRYKFLSTGSYVEAAKAYREIAKEKGFYVTYDEKSKTNKYIEKTAYMHRVDLGVDVRSTVRFFERLREAGITNVMTRIQDVRDAKKGNAYVNLQALIDSGVYETLKEEFPEYYLYEYLNTRDIYLEQGESDLDEDFAAFAEPYLLESRSGDYFTGWTDIYGVTAYIACQSIVKDYLDYRLNRYPIDKYPTVIKFFDILATCSNEEGQCYSEKHPTTKRDTYNLKIELSKYVIEKDLDFHTEGTAEYLVPYATSFEGSLGFMGVPGVCDPKTMMTKENGIANEAERVPLWQLVFHDCASTYWHWEFGQLDISTEQNEYCDLYSLLYGEKGMFLPSVSAHIATTYFRDMLTRIDTLNEVYLKVATEEMTNHEFLTEDRMLQRTTFDSGLTVTVNFSETEKYTVNGVTYEPRSHSVGGIKTEADSNKTENDVNVVKKLMPFWSLIIVLSCIVLSVALVITGFVLHRKK